MVAYKIRWLSQVLGRLHGRSVLQSLEVEFGLVWSYLVGKDVCGGGATPIVLSARFDESFMQRNGCCCWLV